MLDLRGCGTALVTPFRNGEVDYETYASLVDRQVRGGVDFLVPLATTGETPALSVEEKLELLKLLVMVLVMVQHHTAKFTVTEPKTQFSVMRLNMVLPVTTSKPPK